jgi:hypothetical protein
MKAKDESTMKDVRLAELKVELKKEERKKAEEERKKAEEDRKKSEEDRKKVEAELAIMQLQMRMNASGQPCETELFFHLLYYPEAPRTVVTEPVVTEPVVTAQPEQGFHKEGLRLLNAMTMSKPGACILSNGMQKKKKKKVFNQVPA